MTFEIITDCEVRLLSAPSFFAHPKYELPLDGTLAERLIAMGGKVCYDTYGVDGNPVERHVQNLVRQEHYSVLEHVNISLFIAGISRGCSHEIIRHRHFSYSQRSTRYTAEEGAAIVLEPYLARLYEAKTLPELEIKLSAREETLIDAYLQGAWSAMSSYRSCVELLMRQIPEGMSQRDGRKWARGKARQRLPHDLETRMVMTGNLRAWREFLVKRTSRHAEPEIRRLADRIYHTIFAIAPNAFADLAGGSVDGYVELVQFNK